MSVSHTISAEAEQTLAAIKLCALGARPPLIELMTGMNRKRAIKLFQEINGFPAPRGRQAGIAEWFFNGHETNIQCTYFIVQYKKTVQHGIDPNTAIIAAYESYLAVCNACSALPKLSIDRAYQVVRNIEFENEYNITGCEHCSCHYLLHRFALKTDANCPVCYLTNKAATKKQPAHPAISSEYKIVGQ